MLKTLPHVRRSDALHCGNKSACLGELLSRGYAVPPSLILPTSVFEAFLASSGLEDLIGRHADESRAANPPRLVAIEREILSCFDAAELPQVVGDEIAAWTSTRPGPFAVRSSATNEDLPGATFAGQYNSFLAVAAPDVPRMVRHCFASLFNARAALYRRRKQLTSIGSMAVLVQDMLPSRHAGVVFTHAPRHPGQLLVECTLGLGEAVVSGTVSPNRYYLNRSTLDVEDSCERHAIDIASIRAVARAALSIETALRGPQDVEYGVVDDAVYILQARPAAT
jgi:pyruvate,water dikinase